MALNGKIFTIADPNTEKLSELLGQLGTLLGVGRRSDGRYYLADMCQAGSVNKWAKYKPFEWYQPNFTSDAQQEAYRQVNAYGMYWWNNSQEALAPFALTPTDCLALAIERKGLWYNKVPTTWNRIKDFNNYNHEAVMPYLYAKGTPNSGKTFYLNVNRDYYNDNAELRLSDFPDLQDVAEPSSVADWKIAIIYRRKNTTGEAKFVLSDWTVKEMEESETGTDSITLALTAPTGYWGNLDFDAVFAATNRVSLTEANDDERWIFFPESLMTLTYVTNAGLNLMYKESAPEDGFKVYDWSGNLLYDDSELIEIIRLQFTTVNYGTQAVPYYQVQVILLNSDNELDEVIYSTGTYNQDYQDIEIEVNTQDVASEVLASTLRIKVQVRYGSTSSAMSYTKYFNLLNDRTYDSDVGWVTVQQVIDARVNSGLYQ